MALNTAKVVAVKRGITARFNIGYQRGTPLYPMITTQVPSMGEDEEYAFLGSMPQLREWLGDRIYKELRAGHYVIRNKLWESSLLIPRHKIDDDRVGLYGAVAENLGMEATYHPDELLTQVIVDGETELCWDGKTFFATDHEWGESGQLSNDLAATKAGSVPTPDEFKTAYNAARHAMMGYKNDHGRLLNRTVYRQTDLLVLIPPELDQVAHEALLTRIYGFNGDGAANENVVLDAPQVEVVTTFENPDKFYIVNKNSALRPFIYQTRSPLRTGTKGGDDIEYKDVKFLTEARYNIGYGPWWACVLTTFA